MKVPFKIEYRTEWGESLALVLQDRKHPMSWGEGSIWSVTVDCPAAALNDYTYVVIRDGLVTRPEWTRHHTKAPKGVTLKQAEGECPNPLFAPAAIPEPLRSAELKDFQTKPLQKVYEYDIETQPGQIYRFNAGVK